MEPRLNYKKVSPGVADVMRKAADYLDKCGLEDSLQELVRIRASQMNGCAQCIDIHTKDARANGESEQRLNLIAAWREAPLYTERERAALEWAEAVTRIDLGRVPDHVYESARKQFTEKELVDLTLAVVAINGYNRLNIAFRTVAGGYKPSSGKP